MAQMLERPEIKMLRFLGLESSDKKAKVLEKSWNKEMVLEILLYKIFCVRI